ncbi:hypothetical protein B0H14DRAFT_3448504 [Mycena olivaceomarginata]|nr:hypothetical protein B0H14DRAFT_3448504 [Mycena olivaceomarginata]
MPSYHHSSHDIRAIGGVKLKNCLRTLFETAVMLGFRYGEDYDGCRKATWLDLNIPGWKARAEARREEELEQERVWGFDVGWRLATEECTLKASKPHVPHPSLPSLCSVSSVATQTIPLPLLKSDTAPPLAPSLSTTATQTDAPGFPDPPHASLRPSLFETTPQKSTPSVSAPAAAVSEDDEDDTDADVWHEAPEPAPDKNHSPPVFAAFREFAAAAQARTSPSLLSFAFDAYLAHSSDNYLDSTPKITRTRYPKPPFSTSSSSYTPAPTRAGNPSLDWGHDPRLRDLSRALTALGWSACTVDLIPLATSSVQVAGSSAAPLAPAAARASDGDDGDDG